METGGGFVFRKILILFAYLSMVVGTTSIAEEPIPVGVSTALTGNAATYGVDIQNALQLANRKFGNGRFKLFFEDDRCNGKDATTVAQKFISVLKVKFVIGQACSSAVLSAAPLYERAKIVVISPSASAPEVSQAGDYIFRTWPSDRAAVTELFGAIQERQRVLGMLSEQSDYAQAFQKGIEAAAKGTGVEVFNENFLTETSDFRTVLLKLKQKGVDALFINSQSELTFLAAFKQVKEMKWEVALYGAYWPGTSTFLNPAGKTADGIIFVDLPSPEDVLDERGKEFYAEFRREFGEPKSIPLILGSAVEAFHAMAESLQSGKDPREYLIQAKFSGVFGPWSFDQFGDIQGLNFVIKTVKDGKVVNLVQTKKR